MSIELQDSPNMNQESNAGHVSEYKQALLDVRTEFEKLDIQEIGKKVIEYINQYEQSVKDLENTNVQLAANNTSRQFGSDRDLSLRVIEQQKKESIRLIDNQQKANELRRKAHTRLAASYIEAKLLPSATDLQVKDFLFVSKIVGKNLDDADKIEKSGIRMDALVFPELAKIRKVNPDELTSFLDDIAVENARLLISSTKHDEKQDMTSVRGYLFLLIKGLDDRKALHDEWHRAELGKSEKLSNRAA